MNSTKICRSCGLVRQADEVVDVLDTQTDYRFAVCRPTIPKPEGQRTPCFRAVVGDPRYRLGASAGGPATKVL